MSAGAATPAVAAGWGALAGTFFYFFLQHCILCQLFFVMALAGTVLGVGLTGTVNASMGLANKK